MLGGKSSGSTPDCSVRCCRQLCVSRQPPLPQIDIIGAMMIVWWVRGKISGLFCAILCATIVHSAMHIRAGSVSVFKSVGFRFFGRFLKSVSVF